MKKLFALTAIVVSMFMLFSCGNKECVDETPETVEEAAVVEAAEETAVVEETAEEVAEEAENVVEEAEEVAETLPETVEEADVWTADSIWVKYMIQPNDYLTKIAMKEYGVVTMWRQIWGWNYDVVGDDPDLIYPYEELDLKKAAGSVEPEECDYKDYVVEENESLWTIAEDVYGNSYAWIVLMRDNMEILGDNYDFLTPGTILKVRTDLY